MWFGKFIVSFNKVKIKTMDKKTIDEFFDSLSEDVLKEKWNKYDKYSKQENSVTISELLDVWNVCYENTFVYSKPEY